MKRSLVILFMLQAVFAFAQPRQVISDQKPKKETEAQRIMRLANTGKPYDTRMNCVGGNNVCSYVGQELYVFPCTYFKEYEGFKRSSVTENYENIQWEEAYKPRSPFDRFTYAKDLVGRTFVVEKVRQQKEYPARFMFYLRDKKTGERLNYDYSIYFRSFFSPDYNSFNGSFPFLVMSHFNYLLKKYKNQKLVVSAQWYSEPKEFAHQVKYKDIKTQQEFTPKDSICNLFIVEDIVLEEDGEMAFQLTDGKHHFLSSLGTTWKEPQYSKTACKQLLYSDWQKLTSKYGEEIMAAVMKGEVIEGMDTTLVGMSLGYTTNRHEFSGGFGWIYTNKDVMIVFNEEGQAKGMIVGAATAQFTKNCVELILAATTFKVLSVTGRVISAPFKIAKKLINFFGL